MPVFIAVIKNRTDKFNFGLYNCLKILYVLIVSKLQIISFNYAKIVNLGYCVKTWVNTVSVSIIIKACWHHRFFWLSLAISPSKSSRQYPVSAQSWWMYVFVGRPTLVYPCIWVYRRMSHEILQQCSECVIWMVWPYSCWFVGCCFLDLLRNSTQHLCVASSANNLSKSRWYKYYYIVAPLRL